MVRTFTLQDPSQLRLWSPKFPPVESQLRMSQGVLETGTLVGLWSDSKSGFSETKSTDPDPWESQKMFAGRAYFQKEVLQGASSTRNTLWFLLTFKGVGTFRTGYTSNIYNSYHHAFMKYNYNFTSLWKLHQIPLVQNREWVGIDLCWNHTSLITRSNVVIDCWSCRGFRMLHAFWSWASRWFPSGSRRYTAQYTNLPGQI